MLSLLEGTKIPILELSPVLSNILHEIIKRKIWLENQQVRDMRTATKNLLQSGASNICQLNSYVAILISQCVFICRPTEELILLNIVPNFSLCTVLWYVTALLSSRKHLCRHSLSFWKLL